MELMMNKSHYNKYLAKNDPDRHVQYQERMRKINKHKAAIITLTHELLDDSTKTGVPEKHTHDVNTAFDDYLKACIKYFEMRELENDDAADPDTLFTNMEQTDFKEEEEDGDERTTNTFSQSYWGKNIKKSGSTKNHFMMDMYATKMRK